MLTRVLDTVLGSHSKLSALRVLFAQAPLSGREVARRADLSPRAASLALNELVRVGIVRKHVVGGTHQFSVNRKRYLVRSALDRLFAAEEDLPAAIGQRLSGLVSRTKCVSIALFGSYARGEAEPDSDLDVLFVLRDSHRVPEVRTSLAERTEDFHSAFGLRLSPYVIGAEEFAERFGKGDKLIKAMIRDARTIAGKPLAEVIIDESEDAAHQARR